MTKEQKAELHEWRKQNPDRKKGKGKDKSRSPLSKKQISSLVTKQVQAALTKASNKAAPPVPEDKSDKPEAESDEAYILSLVTAAMAKASQPATATTPAMKKVTLKSILKNAKNRAS